MQTVLDKRSTEKFINLTSGAVHITGKKYALEFWCHAQMTAVKVCDSHSNNEVSDTQNVAVPWITWLEGGLYEHLPHVQWFLTENLTLLWWLWWSSYEMDKILICIVTAYACSRDEQGRNSIFRNGMPDEMWSISVMWLRWTLVKTSGYTFRHGEIHYNVASHY